MVKTDAGFIPTPFEDLPSSASHYETTIVRSESLTVDRRQATRVWLEGGEAFSNTITTYVRYTDQQTAFITSFYNSQNAAAEAAIETVHNSFTLLQ